MLLFAAVCYARPEATYDYTPQQQQHQHHGLSHGGPPQQQGRGGVQVTKHVYVHVPPPEPEEQFASQPGPLPPVQKHYKIIFIKAPSVPTQEQFASAQLPLTEEKTIVYVLVKKPDEQLNVDSAPLPDHTPSKPEVYFIKYKSRSQAQPSFGSGTSSSFNLGNHQQHGGGHQGGNYPNPQPPSASYGAPVPQNPPSNNYGPPELPNLPDNTYGPPHK